MDSRTGFSVLLILAGILGIWALFTGKLQAWLPQLFSSSQSSPGSSGTSPGSAASGAHAPGAAADPGASAPAGASSGGWSGSGPTTGISVTPKPITIATVQGLGNLSSGYQIAIGGDGAKLVPIGDPMGSPQYGAQHGG